MFLFFHRMFIQIYSLEGHHDEAEQLRCLENLINVADSSLIDRLNGLGIAPGNGEATNVCQWIGILCDDAQQRIVIEFEWDLISDFDIDLNWFPPTTEVILLEDIRAINHFLDTRRLPKSLKSGWLTNCRLRGSIDLRTLPEKVEILHFPENDFNGTVHLTRLPPSLRQLSFRGNQIAEVVVLNMALSDVFENASFDQTRPPQFLALDGDAVDRRINCIFDGYL